MGLTWMRGIGTCVTFMPFLMHRPGRQDRIIQAMFCKRFLWFARRGSALLGLAGLIVTGVLFYRLDFSEEALRTPGNIIVEDRQGERLGFLPDARGERRLWAPLEEIPPKVRQAFIDAEDQRFYYHPGFDPIAILRAAWSNLREGRVVSGASTLTQQLVRSAYPRPRTYLGKVCEIIRAIKAEWLLSKEQILEQYLNRIPMGNNLVGVRLAAQCYFGKSLVQLEDQEIAMLAALPKAPGRLNPYRQPQDRLLARRNWVLQRMNEMGDLSSLNLAQALEKPVAVRPIRFDTKAPHLVHAISKKRPESAGEQKIRTTLAMALQEKVESVLRSHQMDLMSHGATQAAAMVVSNRNMAVLAYVGSIEYSEKNLGYNNGLTALRSPGSALKPFLYAMALDAGYSAATLLEDTRRHYRAPQGEYYPRNFDQREYGPITIRQALGNSLNLSAIRMIDLTGVKPFYSLLKSIHLLDHTDKGPEFFGLGLAIGNPEVTLENLVAAYAMLASGGKWRPLRFLREEPVDPGIEILQPETSFIITDILSDPGARSLTFGGIADLNFPYRIAFKTGTSTHYRDCWIIGYTPDYTVGVWAGNFDGSPMEELGGALGAGPLFSEIFQAIYPKKSQPEPFEPPSGVCQIAVCSHSGMLPTPYCPLQRKEWFPVESTPLRSCTFHTRDTLYHELNPTYAGWLYDRIARGQTTPYRLQGNPGLLLANEMEGPDPSSPAHPEVTSPNLPAPSSPAPIPAPSTPSGISSSPIRIGEASGISNSGSPSPGTVRILYPLEGDCFLLDHRRYEPQVIRLEARVDGSLETVTWFLDGMEYAQTGPPYRIPFELVRGEHILMAVVPGGSGDQIRFRVE